MSNLITDIAEIEQLADSRRTAIQRIGQIGLGAALATLPFLKPGAARAQSTDGDLGILNFALTLEYLERSFYNQANAALSDPDDPASLIIPATLRPLFSEIAENESAHVDVLREAILDAEGDPVDYTDSDFTFDGFLGDFTSIATLAQGLEDTGVRAYKGQAALIENPRILTVALQIHSVEARHAAAIRRIEDSPAVKGWIPLNQPGAPAAIAATYAGEENTTQGGVELVGALSGYTATQISEAFDEPLTASQVLDIAGGFITGEEGDGDD